MVFDGHWLFPKEKEFPVFPWSNVICKTYEKIKQSSGRDVNNVFLFENSSSSCSDMKSTAWQHYLQELPPHKKKPPRGTWVLTLPNLSVRLFSNGEKNLCVIFSRIKKLTMNSLAMSRSQYPKDKNKTQKCMTRWDQS